MKCSVRTIAIITFAGVMTLAAQKRPTGSLQMENVEWKMENGGMENGGSGIASSNIFHCSFSILHSSLVPRPVNAVDNADWRAFGAYRDCFRIPLTNGAFRLPTGFADGFTVFAQGEVRPEVGRPLFPRALPCDISLLPEARWGLLARPPEESAASRFWHAFMPDGALLLTWENGLCGRDPNCPTNLQIELRRDGRIIQRTDDCTTVFTSCYPFDWDGDGLENSVDPEPTVAGPDAHGTNAEWYRVVCSNVVEEIGNADWAWRTGVDSNAYRFVDFAVAQGPAPVYFTADGASRLGNPAVVALAGTVCRVPLLVGATYSVSSDVPFSVSAPMTDSVEIKTTGALSYSVCSPLRFEERTVVLDGHSAREFVPEPFLVGSFGWDLTLGGGTSCGCGAFSNCVWFACTNGCGCGGCRAEGTFAYEGYRVSVQDVSCGCGAGVMPDPLVPSFGISFSKSGVIFEDDYACSATSNVARRSTEVTVGVTASGGSNGGWLYLTRQDNIDRLVCKHGGAPSFPSARHLEPYETYSIAYTCTGRKESAYENDVELDGCFIEDGKGVRIDDYARLTVIRVDLTTGKDAPLNNKLHRHEYGIGEKIYVRHYPVPPGLSIIANDAKISGIPGVQTLEWGVSNVLHQMRIELPGVVYHPLIQVLVPSEIEGDDVSAETNGLPTGVSGGLYLVQRFRVNPKSVNFDNISVEEVPCVEEMPPTGYFTHTPTNTFLRSHTRLAGAGRWKDVKDMNYVGGRDVYDNAGYLGHLPRMTPDGTMTNDTSYGWLGGSLTWKIPFGWQKKNCEQNANPVEVFCETTRQIFQIAPNGDFSVEKLGNKAERKIDGGIYVNDQPVDQ